MADALTPAALARWRSSPIEFIEQALHDPETSEPFSLSEAERAFLKLAFTLTESGRLKYPELVFGAIKKSGKTTLAAITIIATILLLGGRFAEGFCVANDLEQAQSRVFAILKRIVAASPLLKHEARITADRISFPALDATIMAIAATRLQRPVEPDDYSVRRIVGLHVRALASVVGRDDHLPGAQDQLPADVSYAGFSGESVLLEDLHKRGMALPEVGPSFRAGDGMLFAWHIAR